MTLFTQEEKEHLAHMICSKDEESRKLGWDIIDTMFEYLTDQKEKNKFLNHLNHAKAALNIKPHWYIPYWEWIYSEPKTFEAFKKNILLLDIYHNPNEQN